MNIWKFGSSAAVEVILARLHQITVVEVLDFRTLLAILRLSQQFLLIVQVLHHVRVSKGNSVGKENVFS